MATGSYDKFMNEDPQKNPKKLWKVKVFFAFVCLITLIAFFYAEEDWRGKHDWEQFKREQEAKGIKFDYEAYIPAPVPDDQNFAMSPVWVARIKYDFQNDPQKAEAWYGERVDSEDVAKFYGLIPVSAGALVGTNWASHLPPTPDLEVRWTTARMMDLRPWQSYYRNLAEKNTNTGISVTPQPQSPAADVLLALSKFEPVIDRLQKGSQLPYSRFPVQYDMDDPAEILLPHLLAVKQCAQVLELRAIAELQSGQTDAAADDIKLILRLNDSIQTEPFIITHLVRMAVLQMAIQCIYEGLSEHKWSDAQLAEFDSGLSRINYPDDYQRSILSEGAAHSKILKWIEQKRSHGGEFLELLHTYYRLPDSTVRFLRIVFHVIPGGWFDQNDMVLAKLGQAWSSVPKGDAPLTISQQGVEQASNTVKTLIGHTSSFNFMGQLLAADISDYAKKTAFAQASGDLARIAIALERYHLKQGAYPGSLDALAPIFMQEVPADIINGEPLNYRLTPGGRFILYSVGWNGKDDGGIAFKGNLNGTGIDINRGDWVWRYPDK